MPEILDLGMSDEDYLQYIAQGRDPVQEQIRARNLIRAGVPPEEAWRAAPLMTKLERSLDEEVLLAKVWRYVRSR